MNWFLNSVKVFMVSLFLTGASTTATVPYSPKEGAIVQVSCEDGKGTAFKITQDKYVTAKHVVVKGGCSVNGAPLTNIDLRDSKDIATFTGPFSQSWMPVSCKGFEPSKTYVATGYGLGLPQKMHMPWISTEYVLEGYRTFIGEGIPGMSGGPVINRNGEVVGIVNMRWPTRGRALSDSIICK
jgi:hypothetical protein